jgi:TPR repeat protein
MKLIVLLFAVLTTQSFSGPDFSKILGLANGGDAAAQIELGHFYANGIIASGGFAEAVFWYHKAAIQGSAAAQSELGKIYYNHKGFFGKNTRSYIWLSMAARQGNTNAQQFIKRLEATMTSKTIREAQALAAKCYESDYKDCDGGN